MLEGAPQWWLHHIEVHYTKLLAMTRYVLILFTQIVHDVVSRFLVLDWWGFVASSRYFDFIFRIYLNPMNVRWPPYWSHQVQVSWSLRECVLIPFWHFYKYTTLGPQYHSTIIYDRQGIWIIGNGCLKVLLYTSIYVSQPVWCLPLENVTCACPLKSNEFAHYLQVFIWSLSINLHMVAS